MQAVNSKFSYFPKNLTWRGETRMTQPFGRLRCIGRSWPITKNAQRFEIFLVTCQNSLQRLRRAGLSSSPPVPFSGSVCPMSDQRAPNEGACSPSQAPSDTSPSQREGHCSPGAISDNSVRRHLESGKLGRQFSLPIAKSSPRKAY